ncbi:MULTISPECIES: ATP-binding cassette domain-containing protein [unclassified Breznakia]|uniref:ATP-binding cassette domain-containing protein n=1 Tax=unclassified Breznakia TaxID=2623764 RepID=UPI0024739B04|nr:MULTISPECIES: ATP-binding cassette domain-containing protein [unclassified Breznakia]MDH6367353.1 ABC-2 type transport system ATP-binding protein [Breznakia sp. PH1-1]MDH6404499.1 ABC-2 type transport system ATP-binding protein [Breznakia sp. PF1-11]MDH6412208.1 ABC-2 type transport system ATP-binding protein [Breznakia sp. PFB1-11]MDH6414520.1 ABC-2 type transport system ATP-binding protein [Breznakia sp. PFB1-14]MDH6416872.1 ABC-2 type transport system ATP-binding protein [Breznakia sp. P
MEYIIKNVSKTFKKRLVVRDVEIKLQPGIHAVLGANGSGKTTLFRILCGVLNADSQPLISLDGILLHKQRENYLSSIGYLPQQFGYYPNYTIDQFLYYMGVVKGLKSEYIKKRMETLLIQLRLEQHRKKKMKNLSGGMLRRVGIAQALLNEPKVLILDEPTVGLDPKERINFKNILTSLAQDTIILLSTHIVSDIENIADDIIVMKEGSIIFHDKEDQLLESIQGKVWEIQIPTMQTSSLLEQNNIVEKHTMQDNTILRVVSEDTPHPQAKVIKPKLDDFYLYHFREVLDASTY